MFEGFTDDDGGRVGVVALAVFIAMGLVAMAAVGLLIAPAGPEQPQTEETDTVEQTEQDVTEQTGEDATEQESQSQHQNSEHVTNRLFEVSTVGAISDGRVEEVKTRVRLAPGSTSLNLDATTIQWASSSETALLVSEGSSRDAADETLPNFSWTAVRDDDTSITDDGELNDSVDRATITIDLDGSHFEKLDSGDIVTMVITTGDGGQTRMTLNVPDSLSGKDSVEL